ncbi:MAG: MEKHLA domain-containing protein [Beijerinckiaceae bacterium]|jgi:hypothetical protein
MSDTTIPPGAQAADAAQLLFAQRPWLIAHANALIASFRALLRRDLIKAADDPLETALRLYHAPLAVLSHGTEQDPVLNFGNAIALSLWERDFDAFTRIPSRLTAEPMLREERERALRLVLSQGYVEDYSGVRVSATGRRFRIARAVVWNVADAQGRPLGQAAAFDQWTPLP